jgi:hypothetical protein
MADSYKAFCKWEGVRYGDNTPLSDRDQELWIAGYEQAIKDSDEWIDEFMRKVINERSSR